jgi:hypothetical protein
MPNDDALPVRAKPVGSDGRKCRRGREVACTEGRDTGKREGESRAGADPSQHRGARRLNEERTDQEQHRPRTAGELRHDDPGGNAGDAERHQHQPLSNGL